MYCTIVGEVPVSELDVTEELVMVNVCKPTLVDPTTSFGKEIRELANTTVDNNETKQ